MPPGLRSRWRRNPYGTQSPDVTASSSELERGTAHLRDVAWSVCGIRQAVVREEDDAAGPEAPRGLRVVDDLLGRQPIRADAGPQRMRSGRLLRAGNLRGEDGCVGGIRHRADDIDQAG